MSAQYPYYLLADSPEGIKQAAIAVQVPPTKDRINSIPPPSD